MSAATAKAGDTRQLPQRLVQLRAMLEDTLRDPDFADICGAVAVPSREIVALTDLAQRHVAQRQDRARMFGDDADLFADPAWHIMLHLFILHGHSRVPVSSACTASGSPQSTALRYLDKLEERGLVARSRHPTDRRSSFVDLTARGHAMVSGVLSRELERDVSCHAAIKGVA